MRVIFMGTPDFALAPLAEIFGRGHEVVAVYSRAPKPAGRRGLELTPSPVHAAAEKYGLEVLTPKNFRDPETIEQFRMLDADVAVVVAYGLILPKAVLEAPRFGCLNLHASLLPRWRGAAPIQRAIMAGDKETGVEVMRMEEGLDTGPIAMAEKLSITPDMTAGEAHDRLSGLGADLIGRALAALERGGLQFQAQAEGGVLYAKKIDKAEARVDFSRPAPDLHNLIRGLAPFPGAFFEADFGKGVERIKILRSALAEGAGRPSEILDESPRIACGAGALVLVEVQRAGRGPVSGQEFLRGARLAPGALLAQAQNPPAQNPPAQDPPAQDPPAQDPSANAQI
jgi:methionyl-tRNA formyltransferase